jgi:two-component system response regulator HydG
MPSVRTRRSDIPILARHFLRMEAPERRFDWSATCLEKLLLYDWPGNVRELHNVIERAVALARFNKVTIEDLPERIAHHKSDQIVIASDDLEQMLTLEELEQRYIERVLKAAGGNKTHAASVLGIDRRTLHRKLARWGGNGASHGARREQGDGDRPS